jgi:hypothetical protein
LRGTLLKRVPLNTVPLLSLVNHAGFLGILVDENEEFVSQKVHLQDGLSVTPQIKAIAEAYAKHRARRPVVVYPDPKQPDRHYVNFADAKLANRLNNNDPHVDIKLEGDPMIHKVYTMDGLKPDDLTQDDLNLAKDLWQESLSVEIGPDGQPWIDD